MGGKPMHEQPTRAGDASAVRVYGRRVPPLSSSMRGDLGQARRRTSVGRAPPSPRALVTVVALSASRAVDLHYLVSFPLKSARPLCSTIAIRSSPVSAPPSPPWSPRPDHTTERPVARCERFAADLLRGRSLRARRLPACRCYVFVDGRRRDCLAAVTLLRSINPRSTLTDTS